MSTIYESTHGSVKQINGVPYAVYRGPPSEFMCELAKEIERLRAEVESLKKHAEVGAAIERAKKELPDGHWIDLTITNKGQFAILGIPCEEEYDPDGKTIAEQISDAVEHAKQ